MCKASTVICIRIFAFSGKAHELVVYYLMSSVLQKSYTIVTKETPCCRLVHLLQKAQSGELQYSGAHTRQGYLGVQKKGQPENQFVMIYLKL